MSNKVVIKRLPTGVPGLDSLLGGGLPEYSFNIIAGMPGSGKTTLAHQIMFAQANQNCRALYFTILGEPTLKMLRYQQQFQFFNHDQVGSSVRFINLSDEIHTSNFDQVLERMALEVKNYSPSLVFVDSFHTAIEVIDAGTHAATRLQQFMQQLAIQMASWQATTLLIGEYLMSEANADPIFSVADGILWLSQNVKRNIMVRKIQVVKMRGQAQTPGWHTFRINDAGIHIFPPAIVNAAIGGEAIYGINRHARLAMGIPGLDHMLGGGLPAAHSVLVVGPSGCGKTVLATEFLSEGVRLGENGVLASFEKSPSQLINGKLNAMVKDNKVGVIEARSLGLSIDETLYDMISMITKMNAKRVVIDSLSGFELSLAPEFSEDFRSSLYRMVAVLTGMGVTIMMTSELEDRYTDLRFSSFGNAFLVDAIIMMRYIEISGEFKRVISVMKVRGSNHSKDLRLFDINDQGIILGDTLKQYEGILRGRPYSTLEAGPITPGVPL